MEVKYMPQGHTAYRHRGCCEMEVEVNPNSLHSAKRKCRKHYVYTVDGVPMCTAHAGRACLEHLLKENGELK